MTSFHKSVPHNLKDHINHQNFPRINPLTCTADGSNLANILVAGGVEYGQDVKRSHRCL